MWVKRRSSISVTVEQQDLQALKPKREIDSAYFAQGMMLVSTRWSVFDGIETIPETPELLMAEINSAISNLEFARATALLESPSPSSSVSNRKKGSDGSAVVAQYDARMADEAFKAGCSALAAGKLDEALYSLNVSLSKCPPDKTFAVAKLQSLISLTSQQLQRSAN